VRQCCLRHHGSCEGDNQALCVCRWQQHLNLCVSNLQATICFVQSVNILAKCKLRSSIYCDPRKLFSYWEKRVCCYIIGNIGCCYSFYSNLIWFGYLLIYDLAFGSLTLNGVPWYVCDIYFPHVVALCLSEDVIICIGTFSKHILYLDGKFFNLPL
jgi:hypothetical protein